jgi:hypothetical protein
MIQYRFTKVLVSLNYLVELAKTGRSKCAQKTKIGRKCTDPLIAKFGIRIGSLDDVSGQYGRWIHLECWRVPSRIWLGIPRGCTELQQLKDIISSMNEVLFCGFESLPDAEKDVVLFYIINENNWARLQKSNVQKGQSAPLKNILNDFDYNNVDKVIKHEIDGTNEKQVSSSKKFLIPIPGKNGAIKNFLNGKTIVLTGLFPEIGGGVGLQVGKERLRKMCEAFGAKVTSSVSGKTNILLVGKYPGISKVAKARAMENCQLMSVHDLKEAMEGKIELSQVPEIEISSFSSGYYGNGIALIASKQEYEMAQGKRKKQKVSKLQYIHN